ncbi:hypothetical protein V8C86DRAFT_2705298 [Haematococcus lacustris]
MSRCMNILAVVCLVAAVGLAAAQDVPPECLSGATSLQSACSSELSKASATLGITAGGSDVSALGAAAKQAIASGKASQALAEFNPSASCCKAACSFAATGCLCNQGVVDLVNAVTGVDANTAKQLTGAFATKCKFQDVSLAAGVASCGLNPCCGVVVVTPACAINTTA